MEKLTYQKPKADVFSWNNEVAIVLMSDASRAAGPGPDPMTSTSRPSAPRIDSSSN